MFSYRQPKLVELPAISWADHNKKAKLADSKVPGPAGYRKIESEERVSFSVLAEAEVTTQSESFFFREATPPKETSW